MMTTIYNQTIPNLYPALQINGSEQLWSIQYGQDRSIKVAQIIALGAGASTQLPFPVSVGGTGSASFSPYGLVYYDPAHALLTQISAGAAGQSLLSGGPNAPPTWTTVAIFPNGTATSATHGTDTLPGDVAGFIEFQVPVGTVVNGTPIVAPQTVKVGFYTT